MGAFYANDPRASIPFIRESVFGGKSGSVHFWPDLMIPSTKFFILYNSAFIAMVVAEASDCGMLVFTGTSATKNFGCWTSTCGCGTWTYTWGCGVSATKNFGCCTLTWACGTLTYT